ncbi:tyrosine-protein phosphatase [Entomohabitans teleogrylli]|uniref:tyrosine-protein phosphatase n=1 Tax=Entomohabitans teleogrylli TaxID=1384589 RepID=UPI00073D597E|nr:tyrosine-protein phosphatase [Entomohabitans teleogrylli]
MTTTIPEHPSLLPLQGGINFRDMGGNLAADGRRVRPGKLLRSGALDHLTDGDLSHLGNIPLRYILDYRDPDEVNRHPDRLSPGAHYVNAPANPLSREVNARVVEFSAASLESLDGEAWMLELYRQLPFNNPAYHQLAAWLKTPFDGALVQHCAVGKDRTGVGCALALFTLGCDKNTVMEDYLLTDGMLTKVHQVVLGMCGDALTDNGHRQLNSLLAVRESYLGTALGAIKERYGDVDTWMAREYGLTPEVRARIQDTLLA